MKLNRKIERTSFKKISIEIFISNANSIWGFWAYRVLKEYLTYEEIFD